MDIRELAALADMEGPNLDQFAKILAEAKSRVNASNGKMYFVYLPSWARYAKIPLLGKDNDLLLAIKHRERILSIANSLEIPIVDISQVFDSSGGSVVPFSLPRARPLQRDWPQVGCRRINQTPLFSGASR